MKIAGEYVFHGPRQDVWELVRDPEVLSTALPGTQKLEKVAENEYQGQMDVRVGPVGGAFSGKITVSDEVPPESYTLLVEGRGAPGFAKGIGRVELVELEDGTTLMKYEGDVQIGGKIASVGQRMLDTASKSMIRQGLEALNQALEARIAAKTTGQEVDYVPPSEAEFAAAVARDMAREMLPPPRTLALIAAVTLLALILGVLVARTRRKCVCCP